LSIVALLTPRFSKQILKEHSRIDNFNAKKLWGKKGNGVGQKHIEVWYTSLRMSVFLLENWTQSEEANFIIH